MKHETHFVLSEFQITNGEKVTALCGEEIERANIQTIWDDLAVGSKLTLPESTILMCTDCLLKAFDSYVQSPVKVYAVSEKRSEVEE